MRSLEFVAFGDPKGQPRARACIRGRHAGMYDPGTADGWKFAVRAAAIDAAGKEWKPLEGPLSLTLIFSLKRPKSHYNSKGDIKPNAPNRVMAKPDLDNLAKAVMDALTNAGIWLDDKQVVHVDMRKQYALAATGAFVLVKEVAE